MTVAMVVGGGAAAAGWNDTAAPASMPISSGTLVAATSPSATPGCLTLLPQVTVGWTPTASAATGYRIYRRTTGAYSLVATVAGRASSSYVDQLGLSLDTSYTYYVQAYVGSWTANSATASAVTPIICLV